MAVYGAAPYSTGPYGTGDAEALPEGSFGAGSFGRGAFGDGAAAPAVPTGEGYGAGGYGSGPYGSTPDIGAGPTPGIPPSIPPVPTGPPPLTPLTDVGGPADISYIDVRYTVLVTDRNCNVIGDPLACWTQLDVTLRFNEPGTGMIVVPAWDWVRDLVGQDGIRFTIIRNGAVLIAGPMESRLYERADNGDKSGPGVFTIYMADDFADIARREVYPNPALGAESQTGDTWSFSGNAEAALRALVTGNSGPGALVPRREPQLALGPVAGVGSNVTVTAKRMLHIGDVARQIAEVGGPIGFRVRRSGKQRLFEVYAPADKSATVRFGFNIGNMRFLTFERKAPTATTVFVGGQGEGEDLTMIERTNAVDEAAWGRFERYVPRAGGSDLQVLEDEATKALAEGAATDRVAANVSDSPGARFGQDYHLGDIVAYEKFPGEEIADVVRTVHLQVHASSGEYVSATVGSQAATSDPEWLRRVEEIDARVGNLERTAVLAA